MKPDNGPIDLQRLQSSDGPELRRSIDAVKQQLPNATQLAALAASLSQMGIPVASSGQTAPASSSPTPLKLLLGAGVIGPLAIAFLLWHSATPRATVPHANVSATTSAAQPPARVAEPVPPSAGPSTGVAKHSANSVAPAPAASSSSNPSEAVATDNELETGANSRPAKSVPRSVAVPNATAASARSAVVPAASDFPSPASVAASEVARPTEVALLRDARLALNGNPNEALALAERHRSLYPRGGMVQERELIAISALARLGRHSAVLARAAQFERDFPTSPYRQQISALAQ